MGAFAAEDVDALIGLFYDAALQPELWRPALESIGSMLSAAFVLTAIDLAGTARLAVSAGVDPAGFALIMQRYATRESNVLIAAMPGLAIAEPVSRGLIQDDRAYFGSELWNEVFRPQQLAHRAVACAHRTDALVCPMGVLRPTSLGDFSDGEVQVLKRVLPHIRRALQIAMRLSGQDSMVKLTGAALDYLPLGILIADTRGKIVQENRTAAELLSVQDGLRLRNGELAAWRHQDTLALRAAIGRAVAGLDERAAAVSVQRASGKRAHAVLVAPLGLQAAQELNRNGSGAIVLIDGPANMQGAGSGELLQQLFKLTPREMELAQELVSGKRLDVYADERGVSINTAKSQLRAIFAKTETSRQSELMRLLAGISLLSGCESHPVVSKRPRSFS